MNPGEELAVGISKAVSAIEKLGPQAWELLVAQKRLEASCNLALVAMFTVASAWLTKWSYGRLRQAIRDGDRDWDGPGYWLPLIGGAVVLLTTVAFLPGCITQLVYPEYYAAVGLLEAVK